MVFWRKRILVSEKLLVFLLSIEVAKGVVCFFSLFFFILGCASSTSPVPSGCSDGVAQVRIGDGYSQVLCGCGSGSKGLVPQETPLRCQLATSQTRLFLIYSGNARKHQMVSTGPCSFVSYAPTKPEERILEVQVLEFSQPSRTYAFEDLFSPIQGEILVP